MILDWFYSMFRANQDVKVVVKRPKNFMVYEPLDIDLLVETWMGSRIHVYIIREELRNRDIKAVLKSNQRAHAGSLFMVEKPYLPAEGELHQLEDWVNSLQTLYDGFIYSFFYDVDEIKLGKWMVSEIQDHYFCWYLNDFVAESATVKTRHIDKVIKGDWYIGDITSANYKRQMHRDRAQHRFHYKTKYTGQNGAQNKDLTPQELEAQYELLGVSYDAAMGEVKAAFRQLARTYHPDVADLPPDEAEKRFKEVSAAWDKIKGHHNWK